MKKSIFTFLVLVGLSACKKAENTNPELIKETSVAGATTILVDETVFPVVEDLAMVFESEYKRAKIKLIGKSETEILNMINKDEARIAILARDLDTAEVAFYNTERQVYPRRTEFAVDAITFIANKSVQDSVLKLQDIVAVLQGKTTGKIKTLVFDNPNSSNLRDLKKMANVTQLPKQGVFSMNSNKEVVKYVTENEGAIGVIGVNWLLQPSRDLLPYIAKVKVLGVENVKIKEKNKYIKPNQTNIADGSYPVTRKIFLINFQGSAGLGMGFASYIAGDKGQRIILKSGLVPKRFPSREIAVRNKVEK